MLCYLIDDDDDDRDFFAMAVEEINEEIDLESSGSAEDALAKLRAKELQPDIIFLDLNMPRIDGWECLKHLRDLPHLATVPVVIYSTSDKSWNPEKHSGYNAFLTKQSKILDLVAKLREIFAKVNSSFPC